MRELNRPDRRGEAEVAGEEPSLVDVRGNYLRIGQVQWVLHQVSLLEPHREDPTYGQDQNNDNYGHDRREINVADLLRAGSAVEPSRVIQLRVDG